MSFQIRLFRSVLLFSILCTLGCSESLSSTSSNVSVQYEMPEQSERHSATWLQWPHNYGWDSKHTDRYDPIWIAITKALAPGERVNIVVYNRDEQKRVETLLTEAGVNLDSTSFHIWKTDDVWVRDNGPCFVYDEKGELVVLNWEFNGWGGKAESANCRIIPTKVGDTLGLPVIDLPIVLEGGAVELDGNGSLMGKLSCITNSNRNPNVTLEQIEEYCTTYLGVTNFIWMPGTAGLDITDDHIDGTARFVSDSIIVLNDPNVIEPSEYEVFKNSRNREGKTYQLVELPVTTKKMSGADWWGLYINYYVGNEVVIVPIYNDPNDAEALEIIGDLYPGRSVVGIDVRELYKDGGMLNCVTQQQPVSRKNTLIELTENYKSESAHIAHTLTNKKDFTLLPEGSSATLFSFSGREIQMPKLNGNDLLESLAAGLYLYRITTPQESVVGKLKF